jgi:hypothetical protein
VTEATVAVVEPQEWPHEVWWVQPHDGHQNPQAHQGRNH